MTFTIRLEGPDDHRRVEELIRDAFWNTFEQGADEHYLTNQIRKHEDFVPDLCFVAREDGVLVGSIVYTKSTITRFDGSKVSTVTFGPVAVDLQHQRKGIGRALILHSMKIAKELGYAAVAIFGDPGYYSQLGFRIGEKFDLRTDDDHYAIALQAIPLQDGVNLAGRFKESSVFQEVDAAAVEEFDATFPPREKEVTESQLRFKVLKSLYYPVVSTQI